MKGVFISSIPKSGTHLLSSLVEYWSGLPVVSVKEKANYKDFDFLKYENYPNLVGHYRFSHIRANSSLRELFLNRTVIVVIRDPRDLCNSMLHYVLKSTNKMHQVAAQQLNGLSYEEQIIRISTGITDIDGVSITPSLDKWCSGFIELQSEFSHVAILKYEDFFEIDSISKSIAQIFSIPVNEASSLVEKALSLGSKTKRESGARPAQWRSVYSDYLLRFFENNYGNTIKYLGYDI